MNVTPFPRPPPAPQQRENNATVPLPTTSGQVPDAAASKGGAAGARGEEDRGRKSPPPIFSKIRMLDTYRSARSRSHSVRRKPVRKSASDPSIPSTSGVAAGAAAATEAPPSASPPPTTQEKSAAALGRSKTLIPIDTHVPSPELDLGYLGHYGQKRSPGLDDSPPPAPQRRRPLPLPPYSATDPAQPFPTSLPRPAGATGPVGSTGPPGVSSAGFVRRPSHLSRVGTGTSTGTGEETPRALRPIEPPTPGLELDKLHIEYPFHTTLEEAEGGSTKAMIGSRSSRASSISSDESWFDALNEDKDTPPPAPPPRLTVPVSRPASSAPPAPAAPAVSAPPPSTRNAEDAETFGTHPSHASSASIYSQLSEAGDYGTASEGSLTASYHTAASWASDETAAPAPPPPPSTPATSTSHLPMTHEEDKGTWTHGVIGLMSHWKNDKARMG